MEPVSPTRAAELFRKMRERVAVTTGSGNNETLVAKLKGAKAKTVERLDEIQDWTTRHEVVSGQW